MFKNNLCYIAKHTVANNGWYGYDANLANNGGWLFHQITKEIWDEKNFETFDSRDRICGFNWRDGIKYGKSTLYAEKS